MSEKLLKDRLYTAQLLAILTANLAAGTVLYQGHDLFGGDYEAALKAVQKGLAASGIAFLLTTVVASVFSPDMKARIVFRRWYDALPGCRAFTDHMARDPRIDPVRLQAVVDGPLPTEPARQNQVWYQLYRSLRDDPMVRQVHRSWLLARDWACMAVFMLLTLFPAALFVFPSRTAAFGFGALLAAQYLLAGTAAANHATRFVTTVLAIKSSSPPAPPKSRAARAPRTSPAAAPLPNGSAAQALPSDSGGTAPTMQPPNRDGTTMLPPGGSMTTNPPPNGGMTTNPPPNGGMTTTMRRKARNPEQAT